MQKIIIKVFIKFALSPIIKEIIIKKIIFVILILYALLAQLDRAPDFESGGYRFDSYVAHHNQIRYLILRGPL